MNKEIRTLEDLSKLDPIQIVRGYLSKEPLPESSDASFIHGWLNGCVDRGLMEPSPAQRTLAKEAYDANEIRVNENKEGSRPLAYTRNLRFREHL